MIPAHELLVLRQIPGIGPRRLRSLVEHFRGLPAIRSAGQRELLEAEGIDRRTAEEVFRFFRLDGGAAAERSAEDQQRRALRAGGRVLTLWDDTYPENLKWIYDPPPLLFVRGELAGADRLAIALVGTRAATGYGLRVAAEFAGELARRGITVVSGLARGIDGAAHRGALQAGGRTLAVTGSGLDVVYPPEHRMLVEEIARRGAVLTEFDMGARPAPSNFPRRNRIVSGLSLGTVVVESAVGGGAMITAAMALEQNREVFAVPAPLGTKPEGTNRLIREGRALLVETIDDVVAELEPRLLRTSPPEESPLPGLVERRLEEILESTPIDLRTLAARSGTSPAEATVHLARLESRGVARQVSPGRFVRT
jgi:DNA processing protein